MTHETTLILASGSPRRKELMEREGFIFDVIISDAEESSCANINPIQLVQDNARAKAQSVAQTQESGVTVIGADTIVVLGDCIFGKPENQEDAVRMLHELSGRTHQVITGVCITRDKESSSFAEITNVTFKQLNDDEIAAYVATGEPLDKAGAYGIQGLGSTLVESVDGDFDNVAGLPVLRLKRALNF